MEIAISENTIKVLEAILKLGPTYQREISKETGLSDTTVHYIVLALYRAGITDSVPAKDKKTGRLIRQLGIVIDAEDVKKILQHFKNGRKKIIKGIKLLDESREKELAKKPENEPPRIRNIAKI